MPAVPQPPVGLPHGLVFDHLRELAEILAGVRDEVQLRAEPSKGDAPWGLGCSTYERSCFAVQQLAGRVGWTKVLDGTLQFVFTVDGVPMRFFHGPPDSTPARYRRLPPVERVSLQSALAFPEGEAVHALRVAVDTDVEGMTTRVWLLQVWEDGSVVQRWELWSRKDGEATAPRPAPVELGPPAVSFGRPPSKQVKDGGDGAS